MNTTFANSQHFLDEIFLRPKQQFFKGNISNEVEVDTLSFWQTFPFIKLISGDTT